MGGLRHHRAGRVVVVLATTALASLGITTASGSAATASPAWPTSPNWHRYVETPSSSTLCPTAVVSTSGNVSGASSLLCGHSGTATLNLTSGGATPTIVLDYGRETGGVPFFDVASETGTPSLRAGYSESLRYESPTGDGAVPWGEGDSQRYDTYTVSTPGVIANQSVQGGERYEELTLTSAGSVKLRSVGIHYIADRAPYAGYFVSSSDELNRIWYDSAYTAQIDSVPAGSLPGDWAIRNGALDADGGNVGLLDQGSAWTDYTTTFDTQIVANQAGWVVRGQDANDGYVFILNDSADTSGTPNTLQELDLHGGNYTIVGSVPLPSALAAGTWHTVSTTVSGTAITVSLDGTRLTSLDSSSFPSGSVAFAAGTVGFREYAGEEAQFKNLAVVNSAGQTLYRNALGAASALADFAVPGVNSLASIVDGAKRDRAIWVGDMNVETPTDFYSLDNAAYIKDSLELLGSYQLSSGFVTGALPPQTALHTGAPTPGSTGTYSASYSMDWVTALELYYLYTGDTAFVRQEWPVVQNELAWNASQVDANGLLVTTGDDGSDWDYYDGARSGEVSSYNMIYYQTLLDGAALATAAGQSSTAAAYSAAAAALKTAINAHLYNSSTGLYEISDSKTTGVAQDANSLAVLFGVAPASDDAAILATLKTDLWTSPYGPVPFSSDTGYSSVISPFSSGFELEARLAAGDTADAETLMDTLWGHMIAPGPDQTGTMWENVASTDGTPGIGTFTSLAHGWASMPTSALSGYVLGVQPVGAGYSTWTVRPHPGDLTWAEGSVPTPHGSITVDWGEQAAAHRFTMRVTAPAGTSGTIEIPVTAPSTITVNGRTVLQHGRFTAAPGITSATTTGGYLTLTITHAGTFQITATSAH